MDFLLAILLLILFGRLLGSAFKRMGFHPMIGEVLAGVVLGPIMLLLTGYFLGDPWGIDVPDETLAAFAMFGVILLMLLAGLNTDYKDFREHKWTSMLVGAGGILVCFIMMFVVTYLFLVNYFEYSDYRKSIYGALFIAVIGSSAAIEINAVLVTRTGMSPRLKSVILGAAFVDDIIPVFMIGLVFSVVFTGETGVLDIVLVSIKVMMFLVFSMFIAGPIVDWVMDRIGKGPERFSITVTLVIGILFALLARLVGLHEVIGAFIAGMIIGAWGKRVGPMLKRRITFTRITSNIDTNLKAILGPLFFGYIGLLLVLNRSLITPMTILFIAFLLVVMILGKVIGCGITARAAGFNWDESMTVGFAMVGRGALELVILEKGRAEGLLPDQVFTALVLTVILTIILAPILFSMAVKHMERKEQEKEEMACPT